jgi:hypothetical protein
VAVADKENPARAAERLNIPLERIGGKSTDYLIPKQFLPADPCQKTIPEFCLNHAKFIKPPRYEIMPSVA